MGHDRRVALADAGGLHDDQVEAGRLEDRDDVVEARRELVAATRGEGAEEDLVAVEGVHPDAVAEQRAAATASGRVDRDDGDAELVLLVDPEPAYQLVGQRRLAGSARAGDPQDRRTTGRGRLGDAGEHVALLGSGDRTRDGEPVTRDDSVCGGWLVPEVDVALLDQLVDHAGEAEALAVLGGEDVHAALAQPLDLLRHDHPTAATEDLDVVGAALAQRLHEVLEVLDVPALVRRDRDSLGVLVENGVDDLLHRAVVAEVHHLGALRLEDAPHDVDARVVPVEECGRGHEADRVLGLVELVHGGLTNVGAI